jgi:hypothetical protein
MPSPEETAHIDAAHEVETRRVAIVKMAKDQCVSEGLLEVDDNATLSEGDDNGTYVQAWVWVDFTDTPFDKGLTPF